MTAVSLSEKESLLNELNRFVAFGKLWDKIKECSTPLNSPKFNIGSKVSIPYLSNKCLIVSDVCSYENTEIYLLAYECNDVCKLIMSEDYITKYIYT